MIDESIHTYPASALEWLAGTLPADVKEAAQAARALCIWERDAKKHISWLEQARSGDHWDRGNPVRDTARACAALQACGISCIPSIEWLSGSQSANGSWNDNIYDTCYALIAMGAGGRKSRHGIQWLLAGPVKDRIHPGTMALINTALIYCDPKEQAGIIADNASWLLDKCQDGHWNYTVTTCLVVQSLILAEAWDFREQTMEWLVDSVEDNDRRVAEAAQVLITLKMYRSHRRGRS